MHFQSTKATFVFVLVKIGNLDVFFPGMWRMSFGLGVLPLMQAMAVVEK